MNIRLVFSGIMLFIVLPVFSQINIDYWTIQAKSKLFRKEYLSAIEDFNTILTYKPDLDEIVFFRGLAKFYLSDNRGAIEDFTKALSMHPYGSNLYYSFFLYRGMAKENLQELTPAMEDYNNAIDAWPYNPDVFMARGFLFIKIQKYEEAINDFNKALELDKKNSFAYVYLGLAKQLQKKYGEALTDYSKALQMDRNNVEAYVRRGITHNFLKGYEKAIEDFDRAIQLDSMSTFAYFNRASSKSGLQDIRGAIGDYNKVIHLDPDNDLTYFNRADLKTKIEDIQGAISDYSQAIAINPENVLSYFNRALLYEKIGNHHQAIADYSTVIHINPLFSNAYYNRSISKRAIRDDAGAKADISIANHLNANLPKLIETGTIDSLSFARMTEFKTGFKQPTSEDKKTLTASISLLPDFFVGYGKTDASPWNKTIQHPSIQGINKLLKGEDKFYMTYRKDSMPVDSVSIYLKRMDMTIPEMNDIPQLFASAILNYQSGNNQQAITDLTTLIHDKPGFSLAYFNRARILYDQLTEKNSITAHPKIDYAPNALVIKSKETSPIQHDQEYDQILLDYTRCTLMDPAFYYAYFNMATVNVETKNFYEAYQNLSLAIDKDPKFGEAFYNRGLILILIRNKEGGCQDLSKAGDLGIQDAYVAIKKFCDK